MPVEKRQIKIACIANINNMMFILCRYLRDKGMDAQLFTLQDEPAHFSPEADSYDTDYIHYHTPLPLAKSTLFDNSSIELIKKELDPFDFYIGTDIAPAIMTLIGKKLDVFIPHGSDIYALPFDQIRPEKTDKKWWLTEKITLGKTQRMGIENTQIILFPDEYDIHFPFKNKLHTEAKYFNTSGPMVYIPQYKNIAESPAVKYLEYAHIYKRIRKENELVIFSHSRHNGFNLGEDLAIHQKGNDILIKGFGLFKKKNQLLSAKLILFEYGMDIKASKDLIDALEIQKDVAWMPLMQRKEIMFGLNLADISCGQFDNSWLTCGVVNETLASDIPLLHYRDDKLYSKDYPNLYPILNANTAEEIAHALEKYLEHKQHYKTEAKMGSVWLENYTVKKPLQYILNQLDQKGTDKGILSNDQKKTIEKQLKYYRYKALLYRTQGKLKSFFR